MVLPVLLVLSLVLTLLGGALLCWNYLHDTSNGRHCRDVRDESVGRGEEEGEGEEEGQRRRVKEKDADSVTSEDDLEETEKEEGARKDVRSGTGWWARVRMTMRVGGGAQTRDVEPGAR
ncbi:MAG: hypothetical protein LQ347_004240 [Umbilicaria vellea]|nr:MAG: hypothetical protein LQ347_004240 [Umbilicaria vellea]